MPTPAEKLADARLYFVCDAKRPAEELRGVLEGAVTGGVDLIQLRDKDAGEDALRAAAPIFRDVADEHAIPFLINDRPDLVAPLRADGVHVGQDDVTVAEARRIAGPETIVGLSSHAPDQLAAAEAATGDGRPDYVSIGPVWETPTKLGRPAAGLDYVRHAAANATIPWFAIGGIDPGNVAEVLAAGAGRIVVVRAIADAVDPEGAARSLAESVGAVGSR